MAENYIHIWRHKRSIINVESHIRMYIEHRDILGNTHNHSFICAYDGVAEEFHRIQDNRVWHKLGEKYFEKKFVKKLFNDGKKLRNGFNQFVLKLHKKNFKKTSNQELAKLFIESCRFHSRFRGYFKTSRGEFLSAAEKLLKKLLNKEIRNKDKMPEIFELLTTPDKFDEINQEFSDWVVLLSKKIYEEKKILTHIYQYPWLVANSYDLVEIIDMLYNRYKKDSQQFKSVQNNFNKIKKQKKILSKRQKEILNQFDNININYLSWLFREVVLERMRLKGGWAGADFLYRPLYIEIAKRTNISLKDLYSLYRIDEVINSLKLKRPTLSAGEKTRRKTAYVFRLKNRHLYFSSGQKAEAIIQKEFTNIIKKQKSVSVLKGQPASQGYAKGLARIIIPGDLKMLSRDFRIFKSGEILISTMTQPNMVPMMKKAAAVVTDESGLTSHASIIARELGIPCVVGTEIATKVIKNGDMVKVDAIKGIIKKLS